MLKKYALLCSLLWVQFQVSAQGVYIPLNNDAYHLIDRLDIEYGKVLPQHCTSYKPYSRKHIAEYVEQVPKNNIVNKGKRFDFNQSYLMNETSEWLTDTTIRSRKKVWIFYPEPASMFMVNVKNFVLKINPVIQLQFGKEAGEDLLFFNTRGAEMRGHIAKRIGYYTYVTSTVARFPTYVRERIANEQAVPGEAYWKEYRVTGQDYFTARGYITFNVAKCIDFQFGHDKNFIGNGYRSLFLSDFSANQFFLKMQTNVWRITYTNLFVELTAQYPRGADRLLDKKYGAFHHLNIHAAKWLDIGFFEGVVFKRNQFELQYLNPIIFYRAVEQALGSPDNAVVGLDFKSNIARHISLYGQFFLDEYNFKNLLKRNGWWANKFGIQAGMKYINAFGVRHLDLQGEFNMVRPYTYTHTNISSNYTHYNQPMAHPLGANFYEAIGIVRYQLTARLNLTARLIYAIKGADTLSSNYGGNVFIPTTNPVTQGLNVYQEFGNSITQGVKQNILIANLIVSYQIKHNLYADFNTMFRNVSSPFEPFDKTDIMINAGIRWNIPYRNYEF
jgi:hypothetical protein